MNEVIRKANLSSKAMSALDECRQGETKPMMFV